MQARQSLQTTEDVVDLRDYITVLRRRSLVVAVLALLGLGLAVGYSKLQTPMYTATAQVLVNAPPGTTTQNLSNVISVDTEAQVVKSAPIAAAVAKALGSPLTVTQLLKHVSVKTTVGTFVLAISFKDSAPSQASTGANAFAKAYLDYKGQQANQQIADQQNVISSQIAELNREQRAQNAILNTNAQGTTAYRNAQDRLSQLSIRLAVLASSLAELPQTVDPGEILLPASPPKAPSSPKVPLNAAIGLFFGLACGVAGAFVLERLDDRVRRASDLELYLDAPVLANVPHVKGRDGSRAARLIVHLRPRSPVAEAYRTIRTTILSMARRGDLKVFAVVSPMQREGKSMTSANLAAALAQTDKRVLVVSADIRRPGVHEFFGVRNDRGLSDVLEGHLTHGEAIERSESGNVWVLPGGHFPAQPAELLQSPAMADLLATVRLEFDFVIVDCPPVLGLADCLAILPLVDTVLLVVQAGKTRGAAVVEVVEQLDRVGARVDAAIINDIRVTRGRPGHHAYGYYVAADEYLRPAPAEVPSRRRAAQVETSVPATVDKGIPEAVRTTDEEAEGDRTAEAEDDAEAEAEGNAIDGAEAEAGEDEHPEGEDEPEPDAHPDVADINGNGNGNVGDLGGPELMPQDLLEPEPVATAAED